MIKAPPIAPRDFVLAELADKQRPAVVLQVEDQEIIVIIYETGTRRELPLVEVRPESREGKALGFYKPTYFYGSNRRVIRSDLLTATGKRCPPELFLKLRMLCDANG